MVISLDVKWNMNCVDVEFTTVQAPRIKYKVLKGIWSIFTHFSTLRIQERASGVEGDSKNCSRHSQRSQ